MSIQRKAILALILVTRFWGVTFPLIKISIAYISPGLFVAIRLSLSCLLFLPLILRAKFKNKLYLLKLGAIVGS
ncbi:EamA family transporter, partial [Francisella tularensis]|uniref:EamA family transporter n=1 Tax=Francisella tularensis TaxID=263 RepID=UPI002381B067